jgi:hypothetical protein
MRNLDSKSICLDSFVSNSDSTVPLRRLFDCIDPMLTRRNCQSVLAQTADRFVRGPRRARRLPPGLGDSESGKRAEIDDAAKVLEVFGIVQNGDDRLVGKFAVTPRHHSIEVIARLRIAIGHRLVEDRDTYLRLEQSIECDHQREALILPRRYVASAVPLRAELRRESVRQRGDDVFGVRIMKRFLRRS